MDPDKQMIQTTFKGAKTYNVNKGYFCFVDSLLPTFLICNFLALKLLKQHKLP